MWDLVRDSKKLSEKQITSLIEKGKPFLYETSEHTPQVINGVHYNQLFFIKDFKRYFDNPLDYLNGNSAQFVLFPTYKKGNYNLRDSKGAIIYFCLNKSVYGDKDITSASKDIIHAINQIMSNDFIARKSKGNFEFEDECKHKVSSNDEIKRIFDLIDYVIFLVALGA